MAALSWFGPLLLISVPIILVCSNSSSDDLKAVLTALDKLITYYLTNHKYLNLDGFFGLRVIEGQLHLLILEHEAGRHQHLPKDVIDKIIQLKASARNASGVVLESVRTDDSKYFSDFSSVVTSPWTVMKSHRKLDPSLRWEIPQYKAKRNMSLTEMMSDRCMTELMKGGSHMCNISDACAEVMTTRGLTGYGITHQILWSILGEIMPNCSASISRTMLQQGLSNISHFQLEFCTNNFYEMVAVVQVLMHGKVHISHQDLFLEQQFICPNLGFYEFMKKDYLDQILTWQFPSGCFGELQGTGSENEDLDVANLLERYHSSNGKLIPEFLQSKSTDGVVNMKIIGENKGSQHAGGSLQTDSNMKQNKTLSQSIQSQKSSFTENIHVQNPRNVILYRNMGITMPDSPALNKPSEHKFHIDLAKTNSSKNQKLFDNHKDNQNYNRNMPVGNLNSVDQVGLHNANHSSNTFHKVDSKSTTPHQGGLPSRKMDSRSNSLNKLDGHLLPRSALTFVEEKSHNPNMRHLLVEKEMEGGCLSHKTGVGGGALVMYLRYLIEPGNISWTGQHELFLSDSRSLLQAGGKGQNVKANEDDAAEDDGEEEEEEEEVENENLEEGTFNEGVNYSEGDDVEGGDDQGDDDYNEEEAGKKAAGDKDDQEIHIDSDHDVDSIVINDKKDQKNHSNNKNIVVDIQKQAANEDDNDQEEDHNYYDDEGENEKGIIKRRKPPTIRPHPPIKTRKKHSGNPASDESLYGRGPDIFVPDHPNYTIILFISIAPFFILFFFLFKFIRKRRVHIRYNF